MSAEIEKLLLAAADDAASAKAKQAGRAELLNSLTRRHATLGLAALATTPTLAACGGGGGGGATAATTPPTPAPTVLSTETFSGTSLSNSAFLYTSTGSARDVEVEITGLSIGAVYLRYDGDSAIVFQQDGSHFSVRCEAGITSGRNYDAPAIYARAYYDTKLTSGATYVMGVSGFDVYVKVNGSEVIRFKEWRIAKTGQVACKAANGTTISSATIRFMHDAPLYSNVANRQFDPRDLGAKIMAPTTGSITASSRTLTVADPSGFAVGDFVIVETGGENGRGARGTVGVGGTWPALSYTNSTARTADVGQARDTWAWQTDTGDVYRWNGTGWDDYVHFYYLHKAIPRALTAQITGISGNDLTLSVAATATATNASVYLDSTPAFMYLTTPIYYGNGNDNFTHWMGDDNVIQIPNGTFYLGGQILFRSNYSGRIEGRGDTSILQSPNGCPSAFVNFWSANAGKRVAYNFKMIGNARDTGYGMGWNTSWIPQGGSGRGMVFRQVSDGGVVSSATATWYFNPGIQLNGSNNCSIENITSVDIFQKSICFSFCTDCWGRNSSTFYTQGLRQYIQWSYLFADCIGGGFENIRVSSPHRMVTGAEIFRSTGCVITNYTGINASMGANSAGNFTYANCSVTVTVTDNDETISSFDPNNPLINIDDNIGTGYAGQGGSLINCTMSQAAYADASNNSFVGISIVTTQTNITITGGSYSAPDYHTGATEFGALGILSQGSNTQVTGFTVTGKAKHEVVGGSNYRNIHLIGGGGSSATGCTANEIYVNP